MRICPTCDQQFGEDQRSCPDDGSTLLVVHDPSQEQEDALIGRVIEGRYRITAKLGAGGMGAVFRGVQTAVGREVAIKVLAKQGATDVNAVKRFVQEAKAASALSHPNTITIHDFGQTEDGLLYLVMELVKGETMSALLKREGALRPSRAVRIVGQMLNALSEAHALGIIHRDLKPENVIVAPRAGNPDFLKVLDFGLAKLTNGDGGNTGLTQTGQVFGTPGYMSPEQARGEVCDLRADLYAVGVMLYEMLGGRRPFDGDNPLSVLVKHIQEPPPDFTTLDPPVEVAPALRAVVFRSLAKAREERHSSSTEMHQALVEALQHSGIESTTFTGPVAPMSSPSLSAPNLSAPHLDSTQMSAPQLSAPPSQPTLGSGIMGQVSLPAGSLPDARPVGSSSKAPMVVGLVLLLLGGGAFGARKAGLFGGEQPAPATPEPVAAAQPAPVAKPAPKKPAPEPKAPEPKKPERVVVQVVSNPHGAAVAIDVVAAGDKTVIQVKKTPASVEVLEGSFMSARFTLAGHKGTTVEAKAAKGVKLKADLPKLKPATSRRWRPSKPKPTAAKPPKPAVAAKPPVPKPTKPNRPKAIDDLK